jgi:hypothetical protein
MKRTRVIALVRRPFRFWLVVAAVLAGGGIAGGAVYASIPDAAGAIHGCYKSTNGNLRVVDPPGSTCQVNEQSLSWNQTGQPGQQGPPGPPGSPGQQGPPGPSGVSAYQVVTVTDVAAPGQTVETAVPCPIGTSVLGGGVSGHLVTSSSMPRTPASAAGRLK